MVSANLKNEIMEGMIDWNKLTIEQYIEHLDEKFKFDSSGTAKAVFELINAYKALTIPIVSSSYAIVRWHENRHEDVVCVDKQTALEYIQKYNKLAGDEMCFLDEDIYFPLRKA